MKVALVVGLVVFSVATASLTDLEEQEWTLFKSKFKKIYEYQKEEAFRKTLYFEYKLKTVEHNKLYEKGEVSYELGINQFSDLTNDEIVAKTSCLSQSNTRTINNNNNTSVTFSNLERVPPLVDWRLKGCVTDVKNQGDCRACWAFSAVETLESHYCNKEGDLIGLSEQNLIDCSQEKACEGGWSNDAFQWIKDNNGGISSNKSYPYESTDGWEKSCRRDVEKSVIKVKDYKILPAGDESALEQVLIEIGPVSVSVHADGDFFGYKSGVYDGSKHGCTGSEDIILNHSVVVVGFGIDPKGLQFWIVRNSWGEDWGESGYMQILRNKNNHCGIASFACYPIVE